MVMVSLPDRYRLEDQKSSLEAVISRLPAEERCDFLRQQAKILRDPGVFALLLWLFGAGAHHLYLRQYWLASFDISIALTAIGLIFLTPIQSTSAIFGGVMLLSIVIMNLPYFMFAGRYVLEYNNRETARLLLQYIPEENDYPELP